MKNLILTLSLIFCCSHLGKEQSQEQFAFHREVNFTDSTQTVIPITENPESENSVWLYKEYEKHDWLRLNVSWNQCGKSCPSIYEEFEPLSALDDTVFNGDGTSFVIEIKNDLGDSWFRDTLLQIGNGYELENVRVFRYHSFNSLMKYSIEGTLYLAKGSYWQNRNIGN